MDQDRAEGDPSAGLQRRPGGGPDEPRPLVRRTPARSRPPGTSLEGRIDLPLGAAVLGLLAVPALLFGVLGHLDAGGGPSARTVATPSRATAAPGPPVTPWATASTPAARDGRSPRCAPDAPREGLQITPADVDGDGCDDVVRIEGTRLEVATAEGRAVYLVGEAGDQLLVGDWDCDGVATPGLYRPGDGTVFLYPRWPADGGEVRPAAEPAVAAGEAELRRHGGCDEVHVVAP